ncbi:MAG: flagellar export protein FliJ [Rubripirellula sp.]
MPFQFRFAAILDLRRRERDEAGAHVGQANEAMERIREQIRSKQNERTSLRENANSNRVGPVSVDSLLAKGRYDLQLQGDIRSLEETHGELKQELERRQASLVVAESELKRFEKLHERAEAKYREEIYKREQAEAEDATTRRYIIQRQR